MINFAWFRYLLHISTNMPCSRKTKKRILGHVWHDVMEFIAENPSVGYSELIDRFGEPKLIASAYVDEMDSDDIVDGMRMKRSIMKVIIGAAAVALAIWLVAVFGAYFHTIDQVDGTVETYVEILDDTRNGDTQ